MQHTIIGMLHPPITGMGEWAALLIHVPGQSPKPVGVLLRDVDHDTLHVRLKNQWWHELAAEDGPDLWSCLANDIEEQAQDLGAGQYLDWLHPALLTCFNWVTDEKFEYMN